MKVISIHAHGALDYVTVVVFVLLPSVFTLSRVPANLSYSLAAVHLLMTILTRFPLGILKVIPVRIHKIVEVAVGPILIASPWILGFNSDATPKYVFALAGIVILAVGLLTDYRLGVQRLVAGRKS